MERRNLSSDTAGRHWTAARASAASSRNCEQLSTVAGTGADSCSSNETPVMGVERRGRVIWSWSMVNHGVGGAGEQDKAF
jgi:hypothetical protein